MAVLQRKELESSPLADLHAIASELGLEGFRSKRKDDLIGAILAAQGGEAESAPLVEERDEPAAEEPEPDEVTAEEALEGPVREVIEELREADAEEEADVDEVDAEIPEDEEDVVEEEPEVVEDEASDEEVQTGM